MTVVFNKQNLSDYNAVENQIVSLCKMFFPCVRIKTEVCESFFGISDRKYALYVRIKKVNSDIKPGRFFLTAVYSENKKIYRNRETIDCTEDNKLIIRLLCKAAYRVLSQGTGAKYGWGTLTGIRPVKIACSSFENGMSESDVRKFYRDSFLTSDEKIDLCIETAKNQTSLFSELKPEYYSLYVAIPFCPSRCSYCSFVSHSVTDRNTLKLVPEYIEKLCKEIKITAEIANNLGLKLHTIYIGGGTPTSVSAEQLEKITDIIARSFDFTFLREYTVEAGRPDTITKEKLDVLYNFGIDRISINPQTFNDDILNSVGRKHTSVEIIEKFNLARELGFKNINMDLIAGLPNDTFSGFKRSLCQTVGMAPEHITIHTLSVKRSSELFTNDGLGDEFSASEAGLMIDFSGSYIKNNGYLPYYLYRNKNTIGNLENVGYAKPGFASYYNAYIMEENQTILSVGAGAVTKLCDDIGGIIGIKRIFNFKYPYEYISRFREILERKKEIYKHYDKSAKL